MPDFYITPDGDITVAPNGDIGMAQTQWRDDVQQAYIRMMTDVGDFLMYPQMGADLASLYGQPQSPATGNAGIDLITSALEREGRFVGRPFRVQAIPTGPQSIRFDVTITSGSREQITLSVEQDIGV